MPCRGSIENERNKKKESIRWERINHSRPVSRPPTRNTCATSTPWSLDPTHHRRHGPTRRRRPRRHRQRPPFKLVANCWRVNQSWGNILRNCRSLRTTTGRPAITTTTTTTSSTTSQPCSETAAISRISKPRGSKRGRSNVHEPCLPGEFSKRERERSRDIIQTTRKIRLEIRTDRHRSFLLNKQNLVLQTLFARIEVEVPRSCIRMPVLFRASRSLELMQSFLWYALFLTYSKQQG